jgi:hypothetical protein
MDGSYVISDENANSVADARDETDFLFSPFLELDIEKCVKKEDAKIDGQKHQQWTFMGDYF